jgi:ribosomal protein S18 acetylase RimI-like enzyme
MKVRLEALAHVRSGDKGDICNVGVIARRPEDYPVLVRELTADRVKERFGDWCRGPVERFELANLHALNFVLHGALDGGALVSLRLDPQGKTYGQALLAMPIEITPGPGLALRPITPENYRECLALEVGEDQRGFVAPNVKSLAEAWVFRGAEPLAIYDAGTMIGFVMLFPHETEAWTILRFMIDARHQGQGHGRAALDLVVAELARRGHRRARLTVVPENARARRLYGRAGFVETGEISGGELVLVLDLPRS